MPRLALSGIVTMLAWTSPLILPSTDVLPLVVVFSKLNLFMGLLLTVVCGIGIGCLLSLDYTRWIGSRYDLLPCIVNSTHQHTYTQPEMLEKTDTTNATHLDTATPNEECTQVPSSDLRDKNHLDILIKRYAPWVTARHAVYHVIVVLAFCGLYAACAVGAVAAFHRGTNFKELLGIRGYSNTQEYVNQLQTNFPGTAVPVTVIIDPGVNYADPVTQQNLDSLMQLLLTSEYNTGYLQSWWLDFKFFLASTANQTGWRGPANNNPLLTAQVKAFLSVPQFGAAYGHSIIMGSTGNFSFINVTTYIAYQVRPEEQKISSDNMVQHLVHCVMLHDNQCVQIGLREQLQSYEDEGKLPVYAYSPTYNLFETTVNDQKNFIKLISITAGLLSSC